MMTNQLENLNIALKEARLNYLADFIAQTAVALESQGFTFTEILDAIANYAYLNRQSTDTVLYLSQASYSSKENVRTSHLPNSDSHPLEP